MTTETRFTEAVNTIDERYRTGAIDKNTQNRLIRELVERHS